MNAYLDASAFVSLLLHDASADAINDWLKGVPRDVAVSDFGQGELAAAVSSRVRVKRLSADEGRLILLQAASSYAEWKVYDVLGADVADATAFVTRFDLPLRLPDAIHIAIARRANGILVTTDHQQFRAAEALGVSAVDPTTVF